MLQGTFETLTISDVLRMLSHAGKSGALHLTSGDLDGRIYLDAGRCRAVVSEPGESGPGESGPGSAPLDTDVALEARLVEVCFAIWHRGSGDFRFAAGDEAPWTTPDGVDVERALHEAERQLEEWRELQTVIPSLDAHPHLRDELASESLTLDPALWRLLVAIDGRRSVRDVIDRTHQGVLDVCHALKDLVECGAVVINPADGEPATAPVTKARSTSAPVTVPAPRLLPQGAAAVDPGAGEPRGRGAELTEPWGPDVEPSAVDDGVRDRRALLRLFSALREG